MKNGQRGWEISELHLCIVYSNRYILLHTEGASLAQLVTANSRPFKGGPPLYVLGTFWILERPRAIGVIGKL